MDTDNTQGGAEPSPASDGSRRDACRAAFERWADGDGCLRTIKKTNGSYLDSPTRWAWDGWRAATLTDAELEAIEAARDILREMEDDNGEPFAAEVDAISGLLERLG